MPTTTTTPNMLMVLPVPLAELGPTWASDLITAMTARLDAHNHTANFGVQVPSAGINVNADLAFGSFNATAFRSVRFTSQGAPLALGADIGCAYEANGELYYNDSAGRQVKITNVGALNTTIQTLPLKIPVSGNYTILSTDGFTLYYVDASTVATTINLPASSALAPGRMYIFTDYKSASITHAITIAPNGTDKINGVNANYVFQVNGASLMMTTDAAGNWVAATLRPTATSPGFSILDGNPTYLYFGTGIPGVSDYNVRADSTNSRINGPTAGGVVELAIFQTPLLSMDTNGGQLFNAGTRDFGGGAGVLGIHNRTTAPTSNATNGCITYAEGGAYKCRGSGGTITTMGPA